MRISDWSSDVCSSDLTNWRSGDASGSFNIAAYRGSYRNIQQNVNVGTNLDGDNDPSNDPAGQTIIANGGTARIQGVEVEATASPVPEIGRAACRESVCQNV